MLNCGLQNTNHLCFRKMQCPQNIFLVYFLAVALSKTFVTATLVHVIGSLTNKIWPCCISGG